MKKEAAVVLLSGGLDSATVLYWARHQGLRPVAVIFDYGQRHRREIFAARAICRRAGVPFHLVRYSLPWKGSSLLDPRSEIRRAAKFADIGADIPNTYVPARNTILLAFGLSCAEALGAGKVLIGANALDYSGYPDCRPDYLRTMQRVFRLGTRAGREGREIKIVAPLLRLSKAGIVKLGAGLGVPWELTWSCYRGGRRPCGECDSCRLRARGFAQAGMKDPLVTIKNK